MRLAVDAFPLIVRSGGIQRYAYEMIRRLPLIFDGEVYLQGLRQPVEACQLCGETEEKVKKNLDRLIADNTIPVSSGLRDWLRPLQSTVIGDLWFDRRLKQARVELERGGYDLFWGTNYFAPTSQKFRSIVTVHDLVHVDCPQWVNPAVLRQLRRHFDRCVRQAEEVIAVSEFTKSRVVEACGVESEKISVIFNAVGPDFRVIDDQDCLKSVQQKYHLPEKFLLFVSTLEPRKNVVGLLKAYAESQVWKDGMELVLVGARGWKSEEIFRFTGWTASPIRIFPRSITSRQDLCFRVIMKGLGYRLSKHSRVAALC